MSAIIILDEHTNFMDEYKQKQIEKLHEAGLYLLLDLERQIDTVDTEIEKTIYATLSM